MTLPTLVKSHQRQVYVTQLRKVVSLLSQGAEKAIQDNNAISLSETRYNKFSSNGSKMFLYDNFKVIRDCNTSTTPCFASEYKTLGGSDFTLKTPEIAVVLADGTALSVYNNELSRDSAGWHGYMRLQVDINGAKGPNVVGRDLFKMEIFSNGHVGDGYTTQQSFFCGMESSDYTGYGTGCLAKIIEDGWKMDY